jgi:hypothetical protein
MYQCSGSGESICFLGFPDLLVRGTDPRILIRLRNRTENVTDPQHCLKCHEFK